MSTFTAMTRGAAAVVVAIALSSCLDVAESPDGLTFFNIESGNQQTVQTGTAAPLPLIVRTLDLNQGPIAGVVVNWSIITGNGTLSAGSSISDANGRARVNFTASNTPGTVHVRASVGTDLNLTFILTVVTSVITSQ